ncbi:MAG: hypothetical protein HC896_17360, partial [Bacteroidales bacterium]|nr:hypothetical protein [Bacteroidales bacterium]
MKKLQFRAGDTEQNKLINAIVKTTQVITTIYTVLNQMFKHEGNQELIESLQTDARFNFNILFHLLSFLYNKNLIELIKELNENGTSDDNSFAMELLDDVVDENLKNLLMPILEHARLDKKVKQLDYFFQTYIHSDKDAYYQILTGEYSQFSNWTRTLALDYLLRHNAPINDEIMACLFHPIEIVRETCARLIFEKAPERFTAFAARYNETEMDNLIFGIEKPSNSLLIEKVRFLKQNRYFKELSMYSLINFAKEIEASDNEVFAENFLNFILRKPVLIFKDQDLHINIHHKKIVFNDRVNLLDLEIIGDNSDITKFQPLPAIKFYSITKTRFKKVIFDNPEIGVALQKLKEEFFRDNEHIPIENMIVESIKPVNLPIEKKRIKHAN